MKNKFVDAVENLKNIDSNKVDKNVYKYIQDLVNTTEMVKNLTLPELMKGDVVSYNNKKLHGIPSFSLPAILTCQNWSVCGKFCYIIAEHGYRANLLPRYLKNLFIYMNSEQVLEAEINRHCLFNRYFRWFVSGDIPDENFFNLMVKIAKKNKQTTFVCFTKKYQIVNNYLSTGKKIPKNLKVIFSYTKYMKNEHNLPVSRIFTDGDQTIYNNSYICSGDCTKCAAAGTSCWSIKNQIVLFEAHGTNKNEVKKLTPNER